ncbi:MAG: NADH-quinone oxidoreductase subunit L [bacterium]
MHKVSLTAENLGFELSQMAMWIPLCPIIACFLIFLCQILLPKKIRDNEIYQILMKTTSILGIGFAALIATFIFYHFWTKQLPMSGNQSSQIAASLLFTIDNHITPWFKIGGSEIHIGILLDNMSSTVVFMVTWVACLIQIFSWGYMEGEKHIVRYFCFHSLFVASMLAMVISDNFLTFLIAWELMGLCSYLLIGFFWKKKSATNAQKKAFLTTRIGDLGFFLGIFVILGIYLQCGEAISFRFEDFVSLIHKYGINTSSFSELAGLAKKGVDEVAGIPMYLLTAAALLLFMGTVGKSAQFPLHIWLPDAMEGPTPVSALIHAATMVAAGVYLVARVYFVFDPLSMGYSPALVVVAFIGAFTAFMAATIGVTQYDIKRVLAYSTISQLGYMVMALGVGAMTAGVFHMASHAYFKALLFLGSGAVIYGCHHVQDMRYMGGLRKYMPVTFVVFVIGTLSLMGFPLTAGFFSKDMILEHAFGAAYAGGHPEFWIVFLLGLGGAILTCFYMTRQIFMVFFGKNRRELIPEEERHGHSIEKMTPRESPYVMTVPLMILAVFALLYGWAYSPWTSIGHQDMFNSSLYVATSHGGGGEHSASSVEESQPALAQGGEKVTGQGIDEAHVENGGGNSGHQSWMIIPQLLALLAVALGIFAGYKVFFEEEGRKQKEKWKKQYPKLYDVVYNKYYCDEYVQKYLVEKLLVFNMFLRAVDMYIIDGFVNGIASITVFFTRITRWFDQGIIDGIVNGVASVTMSISRALKYMQSGYVQNYYMLIVVCVLGYMIIQGRATLFKLSEVWDMVMKQFNAM